MKTLEQIKKRAYEVALMHFYADLDDLTLWEPFENYEDEWIGEQIEYMTLMLAAQMLWAQQGEAT
jgi:hypothetical protein